MSADTFFLLLILFASHPSMEHKAATPPGSGPAAFSESQTAWSADTLASKKKKKKKEACQIKDLSLNWLCTATFHHLEDRVQSTTFGGKFCR